MSERYYEVAGIKIERGDRAVVDLDGKFFMSGMPKHKAEEYAAQIPGATIRNTKKSKRVDISECFLRGFAKGAVMTVERARIEWPLFAADGFMDEAERIEFEKRGFKAGIDAGTEYAIQSID